MVFKLKDFFAVTSDQAMRRLIYISMNLLRCQNIPDWLRLLGSLAPFFSTGVMVFLFQTIFCK